MRSSGAPGTVRGRGPTPAAGGSASGFLPVSLAELPGVAHCACCVPEGLADGRGVRGLVGLLEQGERPGHFEQ
eukprot:3071151-Alexandrium_andersonii.AAC.1